MDFHPRLLRLELVAGAAVASALDVRLRFVASDLFFARVLRRNLCNSSTARRKGKNCEMSIDSTMTDESLPFERTEQVCSFNTDSTRGSFQATAILKAKDHATCGALFFGYALAFSSCVACFFTLGRAFNEPCTAPGLSLIHI